MNASKQIIVNGRCLSRPGTGIERYLTEILDCLADRVSIVRPAANRQGLSGHAWEQLCLPGRVKGGSILWSPANTGPLAVASQVLTVHDLSPLEHPEWFKPAFTAWYRIFLPILLRKVKRVITPSEYVRQRILARFHLPADRVVAIPGGVNRERFSRQEQPGQFGRYILFVGSIEPRKNLPTLLAAWKQIGDRHPEVSLVLAGIPGNIYQEVPIPKDIERLHRIGYVSDANLPALYSGADIFVLPSWEEGFGLPVLEAMACGTPVAASTGGALPEAAGSACLLFPPGDPAALYAALDEGLCDPQLRKSLSERGLEHARQYPWQTTANRIWQTLQEAYET